MLLKQSVEPAQKMFHWKVRASVSTRIQRFKQENLNEKMKNTSIKAIQN